MKKAVAVDNKTCIHLLKVRYGYFNIYSSLPYKYLDTLQDYRKKPEILSISHPIHSQR